VCSQESTQNMRVEVSTTLKLEIKRHKYWTGLRSMDKSGEVEGFKTVKSTRDKGLSRIVRKSIMASPLSPTLSAIY
jgi:hypothetical protein